LYDETKSHDHMISCLFREVLLFPYLLQYCADRETIWYSSDTRNSRYIGNSDR